MPSGAEQISWKIRWLSCCLKFEGAVGAEEGERQSSTGDIWVRAWRGILDNHKTFGVLENTARGRRGIPRAEDIGDIQEWLLFFLKELGELARPRGEGLYDGCNSESGRIQPSRLRWSWIYIKRWQTMATRSNLAHHLFLYIKFYWTQSCLFICMLSQAAFMI